MFSFFSLFISGYFILIDFFLIAAAAAVYFGQLPSWVMVAAHFFILSSQPSEIRKGRGRQIAVSLRLPCSAGKATDTEKLKVCLVQAFNSGTRRQR